VENKIPLHIGDAARRERPSFHIGYGGKCSFVLSQQVLEQTIRFHLTPHAEIEQNGIGLVHLNPIDHPFDDPSAQFRSHDRRNIVAPVFGLCTKALAFLLSAHWVSIPYARGATNHRLAPQWMCYH
jgi:hypothetical protein